VHRFLPFLLTLLVGAYLQGCGASGKKRGHMSDLPVRRMIEPARPETTPVAAPDMPVERVPGVMTPRVGESAAQERSDWLPLDYWASSEGIGDLKRLSTNQFHLVTHWGVFGLAAQARYAVFNGWKFYLGYPLRLTNGAPYIHRLDAENNLRPLVGSYHPLPAPNRTICVDPGHGGPNKGTKSVLGEFYEKTYSLDWARRLKPLLERKGWRVVLTRDADREMSIDERVAVADQAGADLFISLHFNSAGRGARGLETYCTTPRGMPSTLTRGYSDPMRIILPNNPFNALNMHLAARVHSALIRHVRMEDRGVRRARFMSVIAKQNRPAILVEGGYLSDPMEARLIATAKYRQQLAEAVARAF